MTTYFPAIVSEKEIEQILTEIYEIDTQNLIKLKGFDNVNFLVEIKNYSETNFGPEVLIKIGPCCEPPEKVDYFYEQITLIQNLHEDLPELIQKVYQSKDGKSISNYLVPCQKDPQQKHFHKVVLLEFLQATPMIEALPFSTKLIEDVGRNFAKLSISLQKHATKALLNRTNHKWDPKNSLQCEEFLYLEQNEDRKKVFKEFFARFGNETMPFIKENCRSALIHSDGSCNNILVHTDNFNRVRGIIDFEDVCHSYLLFECASLLMYILTYMPNADFASIGQAMMEGFTQILPLTNSEWSVLLDATLARHVQSLIWGLQASSLNPGNSEYVLETQERGWLSFKKLTDCNKQKMLEAWRKRKDDYDDQN